MDHKIGMIVRRRLLFAMLCIVGRIETNMNIIERRRERGDGNVYYLQTLRKQRV